MESIEKILNITKKQIISNTAHSYDDYLKEHSHNFNQMVGDLAGYDCPICKNKGYISMVKNGYETLQICKCMAIRNSLRRIEKSGLKDLLEECTFENYRTDEAWQTNAKSIAQKYINDNTGKWFFIGGQVGCGKTHLCTAIVGELLRLGKAAKYMLWRDEIVPLKAMVNDDEMYLKTINPLKQIEVLYIDDFLKVEKGKMPTSADINIAFELLNYRYNNPKLITLISSERLMPDIIDIDEAVGSRIYQRTKGYCLNIDYNRSKNYRLNARNAGIE